MPLSAAFTVNGTANPARHTVSYGATVNLALTSLDASAQIEWEIVSTSKSGQAIPAITLGGVPLGATASFTMPADPGDGLGRAFRVMATVSNGYETAIQYGIVGALNANSRLPLTVGEGLDRDGTHGWTEDINTALAASGLSAISDRTLLANPTAASALPVATALRQVAGPINATHYGLSTSNSAADNDTALAAVLAAAAGSPIFIPAGTYDVSATWLWENLLGQVVFGVGTTDTSVRRSRFRWTGVAGTSFLRLFGCRDCQIRDLEITFLDSGSVYVNDVIRFETRSGSTMTNNWVTNVFITGPATKRYDRGLAWVAGTGGNLNNDLGRIERVICTNYADVGFDITHTQSTGHHFVDCSGGGGPIMLRSDGSAFVWENGTSFSGNSDADFKITGAASTQQTHIYGYRSEGSGCLLDVDIGSSTMAISLEDCSFQSNALRGDNRIISWEARSYLYVKNCKLGSNTGLAAEIYLGGSGAGNRNALQNEFHNVRVVGSSSNPFSQSPPKFETGCAIETGSGTTYRGTRGAAGPHRSIWGSGQRTRTNTTAAWHVRDYPDAGTTTDATATTILEIEVPTDTAGRASFAVVGRRSTGEIWSAIVDAHVVNSGGTVTISNEAQSYKDPSALGYTVDLVASTSLVQVQVIGGASDSVRWACVPELLTVALP